MKLKTVLPCLPVCPYCGTVYRYGDVKKTAGQREQDCYYCKKSFKISKKKLLVLILLVIIAAVLLNLFELCFVKGINIIAVVVTNIIVVSAGYVIIPYFTSYKKYENI